MSTIVQMAENTIWPLHCVSGRDVLPPAALQEIVPPHHLPLNACECSPVHTCKCVCGKGVLGGRNLGGERRTAWFWMYLKSVCIEGVLGLSAIHKK